MGPATDVPGRRTSAPVQMIQANKEGLDLSFQDLVDAELDDRLAEKLGRKQSGTVGHATCPGGVYVMYT